MRKIVFHGKTRQENNWVEGFYSCFIDENGERKHYIQTVTEDGKPGTWYEVHPDSVGEEIGINDYSGQKLFEGDLVRFKAVDDWAIGVIQLQEATFVIKGLHTELSVREALAYRQAEKIGTEIEHPHWRDQEKRRYLERARYRRSIRNAKSLAFPLNFWTAALQKEVKRQELPPNWEEAIEALCAELAALNPHYPTILKEYFQNYQTYGAIGLQLGMTDGNVQHHIKRMLRLIRQTPQLKAYLLDGVNEQNP